MTVAHEIVSLELVAPARHDLPAFTAGAHIDVAIPGGWVRQYSLCNHPSERHRYQIAVLRDANSRGGSSALHDSVKVGDEILISPPRNHFALVEDGRKSLLMAGGIGVTPILCMAERLATTGAPLELHYCARSRANAAFLDRIAKSPFAQNASFHFDDEPQEQRLDLAATLASSTPETHLYVCGPQGFINAVLGAARSSGWEESLLHCEFFAGPAPEHAGDTSFEVMLARSGQIVMVPAGRTIVEAVTEQTDVFIPTSCQQGVCGSCLTGLLEGEPDHRDLYLSAAERAANDQILLCCSRAQSSRLVLDL